MAPPKKAVRADRHSITIPRYITLAIQNFIEDPKNKIIKVKLDSNGNLIYTKTEDMSVSAVVTAALKKYLNDYTPHRMKAGRAKKVPEVPASVRVDTLLQPVENVEDLQGASVVAKPADREYEYSL